MINPATFAGGGGVERVPHDFYPTPPEFTVALIDWLGPDAPKKVLEPACGDGAMVRILQKAGYAVTARDLRYTGFGEGGCDFVRDEHWIDNFGMVITNPPFKLARNFISISYNIVSVTCLLLKATYWNASSRQRLFDRFTPSAVLPLTWRPAFQPEKGKSPTMDVMWCVWDQREPAKGQRVFQPLPKPSPDHPLLLHTGQDSLARSGVNT